MCVCVSVCARVCVGSVFVTLIGFSGWQVFLSYRRLLLLWPFVCVLVGVAVWARVNGLVDM